MIDSCGQYLDGTTDVTRTVAIGNPTNEQIAHYTIVLKAHIAVANAVFPLVGTTGGEGYLGTYSLMEIWNRLYAWYRAWSRKLSISARRAIGNIKK